MLVSLKVLLHIINQRVNRGIFSLSQPATSLLKPLKPSKLDLLMKLLKQFEDAAQVQPLKWIEVSDKNKGMKR